MSECVFVRVCLRECVKGEERYDRAFVRTAVSASVGLAGYAEVDVLGGVVPIRQLWGVAKPGRTLCRPHFFLCVSRNWASHEFLID